MAETDKKSGKSGAADNSGNQEGANAPGPGVTQANDLQAREGEGNLSGATDEHGMASAAGGEGPRFAPEEGEVTQARGIGRIDHSKTHIRFVGTPGDATENSYTEVFGKRFYRGKWVPLENLDGRNREKKALTYNQFTKLVSNPAFELGDGEDTSLPGAAGTADEAEEA